MKNSTKWIFLIIGLIIVAVILYFIFRPISSNTPTPEAQRISTEKNIQLNSQNTNISKSNPKLKETEISHFSTKIIVDDDNRDNNLELTASKINGTIVKNNDSFSFNDIAGNPTPSRGYEKAGIFVNGKKSKGYGGGNCQISTTLYDAVLKVDGLKITERHEHKRDVGYVEDGKDATVVYDELDLKFKNETGYDIKIYADVTKEKVNVKIMKLSDQ